MPTLAKELSSRFEYLINRIERSEKYYRARRKTSRTGAIFVRFGAALMSAAITIISAVSIAYPEDNSILNNQGNLIIVMISSISSLLLVLENIHQYKDKWIHYTKILLLLDNIKTKIEFHISSDEDLPEELAKKLLSEYLSVKEEASKDWREIRTSMP